MADLQLQSWYAEFQELEFAFEKVKFLKDRKIEIEKKYDINVDNLIKDWETKL